MLQSADTSILTFFGITDKITRVEAISIPTVSACISKIGETISRLPVRLYRKDEEQVTEIFDDDRIKLMNGDTGDTLSTVDMWKAAVEDFYLGRGAWIYINKNGSLVKSLHYVDSRNIGIHSNTDPIFKAFRVEVNGREYYDFNFIKLLRKTRDGYNNIPLQEEAPAVLSAAWNALKLENMMNASGGCKPGFLKSKNRLSQQAIDAIKDGYTKVYDNEEKKDKIVVLNDGIDFEAISSTAAELQMNENKKANSIEVCKLFGFPHTVIDGGATEDDNKKFVDAVIAVLNQIETELDNCLLLEAEKEQGYYWAFDTKELTRGNILERMQAYEIAKRNNILQVDEIRREEDFEPLGFNYITLGLADVLLDPVTMDVFTPNTGQTKNLVSGEERAELRGWITKGGKHILIGEEGSSGGGYITKAEEYLLQEQNYKISVKQDINDYSVDRQLVNSKEYHDKFEKLVENKAANEALYQQSKRLLENRDGTENERMIAIDYKTGELLTDNIESGDNKKLKTSFTSEQKELLLSRESKFIIMHNHPGSTRPSGTDIIALWSEPKAHASVIVGHDGSVFSISNINRKIPLDKIYQEAYNKFIENNIPKELAKIKATDVLYESEAFTYKKR